MAIIYDNTTCPPHGKQLYTIYDVDVRVRDDVLKQGVCFFKI